MVFFFGCQDIHYSQNYKQLNNFSISWLLSEFIQMELLMYYSPKEAELQIKEIGISY